MNFLRLPLLCTLILSNLLLTTPVAGQQRRNQEKTPAKAAAAPAPPPPTFDTLLPANSYQVYAEVRNTGQLLKSSALNDALEPVLRLGGPEKEFLDAIEWLKAHADPLATSRLLVAVSAAKNDLPDLVMAIEFSSAEEAAKFEKPFDKFLPTMFPPVTPPKVVIAAEKKNPTEQDKKVPTETEKRPAPTPQPSPEQKAPESLPGYYLQRAGSLLIVSSAPVQLKKLRPVDSKPWSDDPNFRVAYNRFAADPVFVFIDLKAIEKHREEQRKQIDEEERKAIEARKEREEKQAAAPEQAATPDVDPEERVELEASTQEKVAVFNPEAPTPTEAPKEPPETQMAMRALSSLSYALFNTPSVMPDGIGIGFAPDNESFDLRVLTVDTAGKTSDPVPFLSALRLGSPIAPQSPNVIPADSELVLTMSLDFPQIYARISAPRPLSLMTESTAVGDAGMSGDGPVATLEQTLKIKLKDDLLPLLGSEVAISLPLADYNPFAPTNISSAPAPQEQTKDSPLTKVAPFIVVSVRDKEAMRKLLPKLVEGFAGKAAAALAQSEAREDTELVSYAGMFAYAFVGNFLVLSSDPATTRHVVDSYLKGATLSTDVQFRNYTRWQPHELQGQVYVSQAFMESYKGWANGSSARITDEARAYLNRLAMTGQPITYALSNDGLGTLHELHVPKNVILLAAAAEAAVDNPPETVKGEREATTILWNIWNAQRTYKEKNKSGFASLDELIAAEALSKEVLEKTGYKFEVTVTAAGFAISAVPAEYGKSGKLSFYMDQTGVIRGGDHGGAPATATDPPVGY